MPALCSKQLESRRQGQLVRFQGRIGGLPANGGHEQSPVLCVTSKAVLDARGAALNPARLWQKFAMGVRPATAVRSGRRSPLSSCRLDGFAGRFEGQHRRGVARRIIGYARQMA